MRHPSAGRRGGTRPKCLTVRFATGGTLADSLRRPPAEQAAWNDHFRRYPPGDFLAQRLLAQLCAALTGAHPGDFAPWLEWTEPAGSGPGEAGPALEALELERIMAARRGEED